MGKPKKRTMSTHHKAALAKGREDSRHVKAYLTALQEHRPRRGRQVTVESLTKRLAAVDEALANPDTNALQRLQLTQERMDLQARLATKANGNGAATVARLEVGFVEHAASYAESKGITRAAFREMGVPAAVLTKAGVR